MKYNEALSFALDMATAICATPPDRMPFVLCDLRAKGLTNVMVLALRPLWVNKVYRGWKTVKHDSQPDPNSVHLIKQALAKPQTPIDPLSFEGANHRQRAMECLRCSLSKCGMYFFCTPGFDQKYLHRAADQLGMIIGTKYCIGKVARLVWRIS